MARRARLRPPSLILLGLLLALGGTTLGLGTLSLKELSQIYREEDIAFGESPQAFRIWFLESWRDRTPDTFARDVGERLTTMRIEQRRALVHALMSDAFLNAFWKDPKYRRVE